MLLDIGMNVTYLTTKTHPEQNKEKTQGLDFSAL